MGAGVLLCVSILDVADCRGGVEEAVIGLAQTVA